ncbi:MAG TPA: manganese efflux pump [Candidatus Dormibacteraeota bacterium]|nr:manganese efflux pump [Candidatus Dormibacteraeota bacterium]
MRQVLVSAGLLVPLALDTFALAAALGVAGLDRKDRLRVALVFTLFEAAMPIVGLLVGRVIGSLIGAWAGYGAILVLAVAGVLMLRRDKDEQDESQRLRLLGQARGLAVVSLGLSISLDELTVGLSAGLLGLSIALVVIWIAVQAFLAAQAGIRFGARLGEELRERSEQAAGVALILVAVALLVLKLLKI